jgi:hypothetical protein
VRSLSEDYNFTNFLFAVAKASLIPSVLNIHLSKELFIIE